MAAKPNRRRRHEFVYARRLRDRSCSVVAGPVSMDPPDWICPLLGIEADAFNHGGTPEFAAISAVAVRHNAIVETLSNAPTTFEPIFARKPNKDIDAGPWCEGLYAA